MLIGILVLAAILITVGLWLLITSQGYGNVSQINYESRKRKASTQLGSSFGTSMVTYQPIRGESSEVLLVELLKAISYSLPLMYRQQVIESWKSRLGRKERILPLSLHLILRELSLIGEPSLTPSESSTPSPSSST